MRRLVSLCVSLGIVFMPAVSGAVDGLEPKLAVRAEGYIGYSRIEFGGLDEDGFEGGATGSASLVTDDLYGQLDVFGDKVDYDPGEAATVGIGSHVGWRSAEHGRAGLVGAYTRQTEADFDFGRFGFEGELFISRLTLAANAGYSRFSGTDAGYVDAGIAFYPIDRARIGLHAGAWDIESADPFVLVGANAEFMLANPVSAFVRWDASFVDTPVGDLDSHSLIAGVRLYWGADQPSLITYDRTHFKESCFGLSAAGRMC